MKESFFTFMLLVTDPYQLAHGLWSCYIFQMIEILQQDNKILRKKAEKVPIEEISSPKFKKIIKDMISAMESQADGIAIAAPQIGASYRIFLISGDLLRQADPDYKGDEKYLVFINPEITKYSKDKASVEEGCLSVRWLYGFIKRSKQVNLRAYNEKGEKIERGAGGILAQIFQHETDHLNGVLFSDNADELWEMSEEEIEEIKKRSKNG